MLVRCDLIKLQRLLAAQQNDALPVIHPQDLVRKHEGTLGIALGLTIRSGGIIDWRKKRLKGRSAYVPFLQYYIKYVKPVMEMLILALST